MNLSAVAIGFLIVIFGAAAGFYPISLLGVFILLGGLLASSRPPVPRPRQTSNAYRAASPPRTMPPRYTPTPMQQPTSPAAPQPAAPTMAPQQSKEGYISTMALFPSTMFPSTSPTSVAPTPPVKSTPETTKPDGDQELLELAAVAVLLKLLSG